MPGFQEDKARKVHWLGVDGRQQTAVCTDRVVTRKCPSSVHCGLAAVALPVLRPAEREGATHLGRTADSCLGRIFHTGGYTSATKPQKTRQKDPCCPEVTIHRAGWPWLCISSHP